MSQETLRRLATRFERIFGIKLDAGIDSARLLIGRFVRMGQFTAPIQSDGNTVTLSERSFAILAFFAAVGVGDLRLLDPEAFRDLPKETLRVEVEVEDETPGGNRRSLPPGDEKPS